MVPTSTSCHSLRTKKEASWPYNEYYLGEEDSEGRKHGEGVNHWTGAESIEWHSGRFVRNTMHGRGDYRWRYRGRRGLFASYEGNFYVNSIHGYGAMSYPDGKVFTGLFNKDVRYGPGIESFACRRENVGLWRGIQLVRIPWRPAVPSLIPEIHVGANCRLFVNPHRIVLRTTYQTIGKINKALELLKECGSQPVMAAENWPRLYPKYCTDIASPMCNVDLFESEYYNGKVYSLKQEGANIENFEELEPGSEDNFRDTGPYFAWNNNEVIIDMMKHSFKHEWQRKHAGVRKIDLVSILSGPRKNFQRPAMHELDSRTLLMAAYLGHVASTTYLVNERGVDPNISDLQGNTAVMYAASSNCPIVSTDIYVCGMLKSPLGNTLQGVEGQVLEILAVCGLNQCGNQIDILHFLVEAGADVDSLNDSCCTALGIALMRFACVQADVPAAGVVQAMVPPPTPGSAPPETENIFEWNINRDPSTSALPKSPSKYAKINQDKGSGKKERSLTSIKEISGVKRKSELPKILEETGYDSEVSINEENKLYRDINLEYVTTVNELFSVPSGQTTYLFNTRDMVRDALDDEPQILVETKPQKGAKKMVSHVLKEIMKPSKETMWQNVDADEKASMTSLELKKSEMLERIKATIVKLLELGAKPGLVRCPQPALLIGIVSSCPDLVSHLLRYGADVNEINADIYNYSMLDVAVSLPLTYDNFKIIEVLLCGGARTDRRLPPVALPPAPPSEEPREIAGPTLLHALIARKVETEGEKNIRNDVLEVLLDYKCDPLAQFKGRSVFEVATKSTDLLDIVMKSPTTDLNGVINEYNQTILVKMFSVPYFKTVNIDVMLQSLTNLLLFGADPLMNCQNGNELYRNLFEFAGKTLIDLESGRPPKQSAPAATNGKKDMKKDDNISKTVPPTKTIISDDANNYRQATDLVRECARILHIRWLQAKLTKELIEIIYKYRHRHWHMILKEHKNKKACGLWLVPQRCLEIWDLLKTTKKKMYHDKRTLKHLLCMVQFYYMRSNTTYRLDPVVSTERDMIDDTIACMLKEYREVTNFDQEMLPLKRLYVQPELFVNQDFKFDVCFECALPLEEERVKCKSCKLVSFCNMDCMKGNVQRASCHPCSEYLQAQYFSTPSLSEVNHDGVNVP